MSLVTEGGEDVLAVGLRVAPLRRLKEGGGGSWGLSLVDSRAWAEGGGGWVKISLTGSQLWIILSFIGW